MSKTELLQLKRKTVQYCPTPMIELTSLSLFQLF